MIEPSMYHVLFVAFFYKYAIIHMRLAYWLAEGPWKIWFFNGVMRGVQGLPVDSIWSMKGKTPNRCTTMGRGRDHNICQGVNTTYLVLQVTLHNISKDPRRTYEGGRGCEGVWGCVCVWKINYISLSVRTVPTWPADKLLSLSSSLSIFQTEIQKRKPATAAITAIEP